MLFSLDRFRLECVYVIYDYDVTKLYSSIRLPASC